MLTLAPPVVDVIVTVVHLSSVGVRDAVVLVTGASDKIAVFISLLKKTLLLSALIKRAAADDGGINITS